MALGVKEACVAAINYLQNLYDDDQVADVLLEELDTSKDGKSWLVTLSFFRPEKIPFVTGSFSSFVAKTDAAKRQYKVFNIDKDTGEVYSMKIRAKVTPEDVERSR